MPWNSNNGGGGPWQPKGQGPKNPNPWGGGPSGGGGGVAAGVSRRIWKKFCAGARTSCAG